MPEPSVQRIDLSHLQHARREGRKFSVLTCYDVAMARLMQAAGIEVLLVGDTAAEVVLGLETTRQAPAELLLALTAAVRRGAPQVFLMGDLPYECRCDDQETTIHWAKRFMIETGCDAVKIEVAGQDIGLVTAMRDAGIPVVAHLGLLPQTVDPREGYRAQGRDAQRALEILDEAREFEKAGAAILLLEAVASEVAREVTSRSSLPVIGCCAGPHCDGTVVVLHDMIGLKGGHPPRSVKQYVNLAEVLTQAYKDYVSDIHAGRFPVEENAIHMKPGEWEKLMARADDS